MKKLLLLFLLLGGCATPYEKQLAEDRKVDRENQEYALWLEEHAELYYERMNNAMGIP
jgi:hypothetical protein